MKELFTMWKYTRMIVLVALVAAVYAAVLIPFKPIPIIPGFTELRPANVLPVVCSLMFGPAAAWGAAFGNTIGDFFGTFGLGTLFGAVGNFFYGYIPYRVWQIIAGGDPVPWSGRRVIQYLLVSLLASLVCGIVVGWGIDLLGFVPFAFLANIIWPNNFFMALVLGLILLPLLYPRTRQLGLLYQDIMESSDLSRSRFGHPAHLLLWILTLVCLFVGTGLSLQAEQTGFWASLFPASLKGATSVGAGLAPLIVLTIVVILFL